MKKIFLQKYEFNNDLPWVSIFPIQCTTTIPDYVQEICLDLILLQVY